MAKRNYEKIVRYKPEAQSEIIRKLPFWWFTDIAIQFGNKRKKDTVIYGVFDNELKQPFPNPFSEFNPTIDHSILYNPKEYPEDRNFQNFPLEEGSPFYESLEELLKSEGRKFDDINLVYALMRYYSMGRGEVYVVTLTYYKNKKQTLFGRVVLDQSLMGFLDRGGIDYLDKVFQRKNNSNKNGK